MKLAVAASLFLTTHLANNRKKSVYVWGNGLYVPRPDAPIAFHNFQPKLIKSYSNIKDIYFGQFYEALIDQKGKLFITKKQLLPALKDPKIDDHSRSQLKELPLKQAVEYVCFTKNYIWALADKNVFQFQVKHLYDQEMNRVSSEVQSKGRRVEALKDIVAISSGIDHFICLNSKGQVFAMGDDTYGQCGTRQRRAMPFSQKRVRFPAKVQGIPRIVKIASGGNHNLAIDETGSVFGWGSNSNMQLSQQSQYSKSYDPLLAISVPTRITKNLQSGKAQDLACGEEFSIIVTKHRFSNQTQVFGMGHNLHGELGTGFMNHVSDVTKIDHLSNYKIKDKQTNQIINVEIDMLRCGLNHCIAKLNVGAVMAWGANEYGQQGNRKRVYSGKPTLMKQFSGKGVSRVSAGFTSSAVIMQQE